MKYGGVTRCLAGKSSARNALMVHWVQEECNGTKTLPQKATSVSPPLSLFLFSEDGWHAISDASSGSLTYFRKYHRFLLIAPLSSRPLRTSLTGPTNSLITSSPRSPFSHAHVVAWLFNTKIKTTTILNNVLGCKRNIAIKQSGNNSGEIFLQRNFTSKYMWFHRNKIVKKSYYTDIFNILIYYTYIIKLRLLKIFTNPLLHIF